MSSSQRPERVVHQDYIARIRYSNALPPPPNPPKLLNIPGTSLAGGQYTSAGYASRLAREQPLNIEADAELGMPIDLIGIPGIFDGDESAISAQPGQHTLHAADKALLKPLSALGKTSTTNGAVSFLRRTEYVAPQGTQQFTSSTSKDLLRLRNDPKRRKISNVNKDDPVNIIRNVVKGFDIAYPRDAYKGDDSTVNIRGAAITDAEAKAWSNPKHPTKPGLQLVDSYPVLPDLEALPTIGYFSISKFITNPVGQSESYDARLEAGILRPVEDPAQQAEYERKLAAWDSTSSKLRPMADYDYDYFLPVEASAVRGIKRKFDVNDPENDDEELYTHEIEEGRRVFKYEHQRKYETYGQHGNADNYYGDSVAVALHDPEAAVGVVPGVKERLVKAAYYYPIIQRTALRAKRQIGIMAMSQGVEDRVDELNVTVRDWNEDELATQESQRAKWEAPNREETTAVEAPAG